MKNILTLVIILLFFPSKIFADRHEFSLNQLIEQGYSISKSETKIVNKDIFKIFTLNKKKEIYICSIIIDSVGFDKTECIKP